MTVISFCKRASLVFLFFLWEGVITAAVDLPLYVGKQATAGIILGLSLLLLPVLPLVTHALPNVRRRWGVMALSLLVYCVVISAVSNTIFFGYGINNWLFATYTILPILIIFPLRLFSYSVSDIVCALKWLGWFAAGLLVVDYLAHLSFMQEFYRLSVFQQDARRIVILKNEIVLSLLLTFASYLSGRHPTAEMIKSTAPVGCAVFALVVIMESRLAIIALAVAIFLMIYRGRLAGRRALTVYLLGAIAMLPVAFYTVDKYTAGLGASDYAQRFNVSIRAESFTYYWDYFLQTGGLGFGIMSGSEGVWNIFTAVIANAYNFMDLGLAGALFQFGVIGLGLVLWMTIRMARTLLAAARTPHPARIELLAAGCFIIGFEVSAVPLNFFTVPSTVMLGGTLWYLAFRAEVETAVYRRAAVAARGRLQIADRRRPSRPAHPQPA